MRRLAKLAARMEGAVYALYRLKDGTYTFIPDSCPDVPVGAELVEYVWYE